MEYKLTERGIKEARKKKTVLKSLGEAASFGGPWKGEEYSNILLITLLNKPRKSRDAHELTIETFNPPRPNEAKVSQVLSHLASKGLVKAEPTQLSHSGFSDKSGGRLSRKHHRGWKRARF